MKFVLTEDQEALRDGIRSLCTGRFGMERVRAGFDADMWKDLADAGVFTLRDLGLGLADAAVVFEELGRALVPGPLVWGYLNGRDDQIAGGFEHGTNVVHHFEHLDVIYVITEEGVIETHPGALSASAVPNPLDPLTPAHTISGWGSGVSAADRSPDAWRTAGTVLTSAYLVGMAHATTDLAVAYAKERQQFDKPIGSFQAVKHICADMLVRTEVARSSVWAAAVTGDERAVSAAKVLAGEAALDNGKACVQVHGGMGFTWEVDVHLYLKRAWLLDTVFGSVDHHAAAVAELI